MKLLTLIIPSFTQHIIMLPLGGMRGINSSPVPIIKESSEGSQFVFDAFRSLYTPLWSKMRWLKSALSWKLRESGAHLGSSL